jgi:glutamine synthetase
VGPTDELAAFLARHPETAFLDVMFCDISGVLRGKRIPIADAERLYTEGMQGPVSAITLSVTGHTDDPFGRGNSDGDPDQCFRPVTGTLAPVPWLGPQIAQVLCSFWQGDGSPEPSDPRQVLAGVLARFDGLDLTPMVAVELEFFLIDRERNTGGAPLPPIAPGTGRRMPHNHSFGLSELESVSGIATDFSRTAEAQGLSPGTMIVEYSAGQFEVNLRHKPDAMRAADEGQLLQRLVRNVAKRHDMEATFMAKPYPDGAGSGLHFHVSLLDRNGRNLFADGEVMQNAMLRHAVGGMFDTMAEAMAFFAPNMNSYRRLAPGQFAPTGKWWAYDHRGVAIRIPSGPPEARRLEHRMAGADAQIHLALAAVLAGIHHGLTNQIAPPAPIVGPVPETGDPDLPVELGTALARLGTATVLPAYLGAEFCRLYAEARRLETAGLQAFIPPAEYDYYLRTDG